jgi:DNA-3-methyladenine glycosylase II
MKKALEHLQSGDPVLAELIRGIGPCRIRYSEPVFRSLARSIVFQQLNGKAAGTIFDRFERACGAAGVTAEAVARLRPARMRAAGLSSRKSEYLKDLARHTIQGSLRFEELVHLPDEAVVAELTRVKGVGVWTAHMFLIFALRRPDVLPTGDYGIRAAMRKVYSLPEMPKPALMEEIARPWRPWTSVACWYLWRSLDGQAGM